MQLCLRISLFIPTGFPPLTLIATVFQRLLFGDCAFSMLLDVLSIGMMVKADYPRFNTQRDGLIAD